MKTPPFLLGAALVFWGWQSGFVGIGAVMALLLEGSRWLKVRWDFSDQDFERIWTFCSVLFLAAALYAFTSNEGPSNLLDFFQDPNFATQRNAGVSTARSAGALLRWLPMLFFLFMAAQAYSTREAIPLETISLILQRRWRRVRRQGSNPPPSQPVNVAYPYFALCLFASSLRSSDGNTTYYWGMCGLLAWALWPLRSRRFGLAVWALSLVTAFALGYVSQQGVAYVQNYVSNLNPQWLVRFTRRGFDPAQTRTQLGRIGRLKGSAEVVLRIETKDGRPPSLLREASYRTFRFHTWTADFSTNDFFNVPSAPTDTTYVLLPGKTNSTSVKIGCYLEGRRGLLPLPPGCGRLENLMAITVMKSSLGSVLVEGPGLVLFDSFYGPGASLDSGANFIEDLDVPSNEVAALQQVVAELRLKERSPEDAVRALGDFFLDKFTYSTWQERTRFPRKGDTPMSRFLLRTRAGHCEFFATAAVLLLREAGIPARYAVGYAVHEGAGNKYVARQRDAHAWCLVWDASAGLWRDFDPTPGSWLPLEAKRGSRFQPLWDGWSRLVFELSKIRWGQTRWREYLIWALVPMLVLLLYQILFGRRRRRRSLEDSAARNVWPGLDSEFYELEKRLAAAGHSRGLGEPLSVWLKRITPAPTGAPGDKSLQAALRLHYRYRFDPHGLTADERTDLKRLAQMCLREDFLCRKEQNL